MKGVILIITCLFFSTLCTKAEIAQDTNQNKSIEEINLIPCASNFCETYTNTLQFKNNYNSKTPKSDYENNEVNSIHKLIETDKDIEALEHLNKMQENSDVNYEKALAYSHLKMYSNAQSVLKTATDEESESLKEYLKATKAFTITPSYTFLNQELTDIYDLDIRKTGIAVSEYGVKNIKAFLELGMYVYISGNYKDNHLSDFTTEFRGGIEGRINEKFEHRIDLGVKAFQNGGALLNTNSWIKYYKSDKLNFKVGFKRDNAEQSYLSAVGFPINGVFTGRVTFNNAYGEIYGKLNKDYYYSLNVSGGAFNGQNLQTNPYIEGTAMIGKKIYNNPKNPWIQNISAELISYNGSYQINQFTVSNPENPKRKFGGYFSPAFTSGNSLNLKLNGHIKKYKLKYGLNAFAGEQAFIRPDQQSIIYGILPYLKWDLNEHLSVNLSYAHTYYSTFLRHYFYIGVDAKLFRKNRKH